MPSLTALTEKQACALRLRNRLGTTKAVAEVLDISAGSASRLLSRARRSLEVADAIRTRDGDTMNVDDVRRMLGL
jgi:DNA-directed RNA polymerase specialized sigma24 family protein